MCFFCKKFKRVLILYSIIYYYMVNNKCLYKMKILVIMYVINLMLFCFLSLNVS